ncbi:coproporphyrinogen III oxidase family protein [candidate division KSB1 bacterium]|nr:coproporphyrinogen III oxidase family protein [candidate division KSB1 bacterium]NIR69153.1 coproporphyrinogen III oxidase family protein [candidate division KSB1 bacterium]NIS25664.1 coproporphyrinogen III oxidase family protein [candidate division KSB1 bacterium]NIT72532.1 coproporphyrinogen III oxidase family protein [candidate division KSB1 bacterium]NIU26341.1 coproporphyrinogen III oxidase family protein [candidate division KSB1 bacterium]
MSTSSETLQPEPATSRLDLKETEVGSVFVSNYPPYSFWSEDDVSNALNALNSQPNPENTVGLYLHIPFCRKRCKFCYFRVYTDKNASQIERYLDRLAKEIELYSELSSVKGRPLKFIYFGGGTPSYISAKHLKKLVSRVKAVLPWESAEEVTFECEPGTLSQSKLEAIREVGVSRLSLGVENFSDFILKENGRAHLSKEIFEVMPWIEVLDFDQLNIDLISGMVGETWESWKDNVKRTIDMQPDSVTIYQMELPYNTVYTKQLFEGNGEIHVPNWQTKREWHDYAFEELASAGYEISSAYTMVKDKRSCQFVYRDSVWHGTDMLGTGVASFGHMSNVHMQNVASWNDYLEALDSGQLPLSRAFPISKEERLVREMILQLKLGRIETDYFKKKFDVEITEEFSVPYEKLRQEGLLTFDRDKVELTRAGLLRVDQLLPEFYHTKYRDSRYT